jgi:caa(3)-type oxidase subunit IV
MASHGSYESETVHDDPTAHADNPAAVVAVYVALLVGAIVTIGISFAHVEGAIYLHMLISAVQVCIVGYYWMHLNRSDALTWLTAGSAFFIMMILFALPLGDYLTRQLGGL